MHTELIFDKSILIIPPKIVAPRVSYQILYLFQLNKYVTKIITTLNKLRSIKLNLTTFENCSLRGFLLFIIPFSYLISV